MEPTQRRNTRSGATRLITLSFPSVTEKNWGGSGRCRKGRTRICEAMGYADHQRVSAVHYDTDNVHIHIAINKSIHKLTTFILKRLQKTRSAVCGTRKGIWP
ncbi:relaxase/mobilization nuclease domain-containing protein [Enterobacter kobei]|uniref:relaxase/mobilization nuclease domain-containing protein n=1 Tax=Enterobacter kobei TaxID=208224 RepID=UPI00388DF65F